jgi:hypothetical protein
MVSAIALWPGVRRAGLRRLSGGADAGPHRDVSPDQQSSYGAQTEYALLAMLSPAGPSSQRPDSDVRLRTRSAEPSRGRLR